ncbi:FRG domain-containing protein [Methylomarinum sp. Ch1-1]|uniref:FRG domain-containing protein n=1 Tax=Methylomarinum roseum TaxID=3067653 RepID=A0AAU7NVT9_9GAMM|nr:FRG domain-containing protein [Methylomarinum sp. Ch1-1]MDP4522843.1 FRG domain-containing protein [Methylomarinum sp. Ch1-1]
MQYQIAVEKVKNISELIAVVEGFKRHNKGNRVYFRGENEDHGANALTPSIYRSQKRLQAEDKIYREMQRFNDHEFGVDKTAFDKLSRMQHHRAPTRLLDLSEDILSALYFALDKKGCDSMAVVYLIEIDEAQVKYYDSDAVSVVANLVKSPLNDGVTGHKSKCALLRDATDLRTDIEEFNQTRSAGFLLHDIKEEKGYFSHKINPNHLLSIHFVKPKLTNNRLHGQKGAYLLFGLNEYDINSAIPVLDMHDGKLRLNSSIDRLFYPIVKMTKVLLSADIRMKDLERLGVTRPYIYPEMERVAEYFVARFEQ